MDSIASDPNLLTCKVCNQQCESKMALPSHIFGVHKIKFEEYLVKFYLNGVRPTCHTCGAITLYKRGKYKFSKYCPAHIKDSQVDWSKQNGFGAKMDAGWKKGLTKETNASILAQSEKMIGKNNPFYGKKLSSETILNLSESRKEITRISLEEYEQRKNGTNSICLSPYSEYKNLSKKNLKFLCKECNTEFIGSVSYNNCKLCVRKRLANDKERNKKISDSIKLSEEEFNNRILSRKDAFVVLTPYSEYQNHDVQKLLVECVSCKQKIERTLTAIYSGTQCKTCFPFSKEEKEINDFLISKGIIAIRNDRNLIKPKELDFLIAEKNLAIEFNGLFWHTENNKSKDYHSEKTDNCKLNGYSLFHIFSDEWQNKKDIVKSMMANRLGILTEKINARDCEIFETETQTDLSNFTNATHISGHVQYSKAFYLKKDNKIVCALTLRKPFHDLYNNMIEIARFSSLLDTVVVGGFSKLLKKAKIWAKTEGYSGILSYADLRFGEGKVYLKNGFSNTGKTPLDYWYTDGKQRFNRFKFRAQNGKSEKQIAEEAGVRRIYGCGSNIYLNIL